MAMELPNDLRSYRPLLIGKVSFKLLVGQVIEQSEWVEQHVSVSGHDHSRYSSPSVSAALAYKKEIWLRTDDGEEKNYINTGRGARVKNGDRVAVIVQGKDPIVELNLTTGRLMCRPSRSLSSRSKLLEKLYYLFVLFFIFVYPFILFFSSASSLYKIYLPLGMVAMYIVAWVQSHSYINRAIAFLETKIPKTAPAVPMAIDTPRETDADGGTQTKTDANIELPKHLRRFGAPLIGGARFRMMFATVVEQDIWSETKFTGGSRLANGGRTNIESVVQTKRKLRVITQDNKTEVLTVDGEKLGAREGNKLLLILRGSKPFIVYNFASREISQLGSGYGIHAHSITFWVGVVACFCAPLLAGGGALFVWIPFFIWSTTAGIKGSIFNKRMIGFINETVAALRTNTPNNAPLLAAS